MDSNNFGVIPKRFEKEPNEPLVDFNFAYQHKFECGSSWPYIICGAMTENDRKAYKKWRAAHSDK